MRTPDHMTIRRFIFLALALLLSPEARAGDLQPQISFLADSATAEGASVAVGRDGWLFFVPELRFLSTGPFWGDAAQTASRAPRPDARDPIPAILDVHRQLQEQGVKLLLVPVPAKASIYPGRLIEGASSQPRTDQVLQDFYQLLRHEGVDVLDLTDAFIEHRDHEKGPLFCLQDTHWSGVGCVVAAREVARALGKSSPAEFHDATWRDIEINGDLRQMLGDDSLPRERIPLRVITENDQPASPSPLSSVIVLGDSHGLVFHDGGDMHYRGAGFADQLMAELGQPVDVVAVRGSGATPARINLFRRTQRDPDYWEGKDAVVWVFSVREFTESDGWRIVPIRR